MDIMNYDWIMILEYYHPNKSSVIFCDLIAIAFPSPAGFSLAPRDAPEVQPALSSQREHGKTWKPLTSDANKEVRCGVWGNVGFEAANMNMIQATSSLFRVSHGNGTSVWGNIIYESSYKPFRKG